ncbi:hypothetical protein ILUMI_06417 [Ignelater luminosus]|uniref:LisH domain-containing protein n=1 Tax=Ignelater luminosus TaxID=2038154 RepID=A0A8K0DFK8_IGNLU|nr:hypothetical protein ILUMI_06417 [Ignelater luminosus]
MNEDNIVPAVSVQQEEIPSEMSAAEFQRRLYAWFEDRGLLSELRAHLRKQMIGVLKDTAIGRTVSAQAKQTISPKLQALNLLIAEFLLQQDYHYSLSVFSTEVPLISVLPEFPGLTVNYCSSTNNRNEVSTKKWQFSEKDAWDILETLGVHRDTREGQNIFIAYYNNESREPLLTCIIRMLHTMQGKSRTNLSIGESNNIKEISSDTNNNCDLWIQNVNEILTSNSVVQQTSEEIVKVLKEIIDAEKKRLKQEAREEYLKLQFTLQLQMAKKEEEQRKKLLQIQKSLEVEKTKWQTTKQSEADDFHTKLQHHKNILRDRYQDLIARERDVYEREQQVRQKEIIVESQQQNLELSFDTLCHERQNITELQDRLNHELQEKQRSAKHDAEFLKGLQDECKSMKDQIDHTKETVFNVASKGSVKNVEEIPEANNLEQTGMRNLIKQLQMENSDLRNLNSEQQIRIEELSQRAAYLMRDLESTRAVVDANRRLSRSGILTAPPLAAPPHLVRNYGNSWSGAGEEGFRTSPPTSPREYRHLHNSRDGRRRVPPRRLTIHSSSSSDDHSPTNEILLEARERLRRLEQEGEDVDRQYRMLKSRHQTQSDYYNYYRSLQHHGMFGSYFSNSYDKQRYGLNLQQENMPQLFITSMNPDDESSDPHNIDVYPSNVQDSQYYTPFKMKQQKDSAPGSPQVIELHSAFKLNKKVEVNGANQENKHQEENSKKENEDDKPIDAQSIASSGILGEMLAAGTSGVSLSGIDTTDEKSDSPTENPTNE